jgi:hypothetical protein
VWPAWNQGCQIVCFQTKNPNLGKFWRALEWKMSIYFMAIWNMLRTFGKCYDHLVHFVLICYIFSRFWYHVPTKIWQPCMEPVWLDRKNFLQLVDFFLWAVFSKIAEESHIFGLLFSSD